MPYINFTIVPQGFTSSGPATLTFFDVNGNFVEQVISPTLSGQIIYPGARPDRTAKAWTGPAGRCAPDGSGSGTPATRSSARV